MKKINSIKSAADGIDEIRAYYLTRINTAIIKAGNPTALETRIGLGGNNVRAALRSWSIVSLRRLAEKVDEAGL